MILRQATSTLVALALFLSSSGLAFATEVEPTINNAGLFTSQTGLPKVDNATGAFTYRVPLDIPPGRNGLTPDVALEYNSQSLVDGPAGYGWSLSIPYIERMNTTGSEDLYGSDATSRSSLDGELTASTTPAATATTSAKILDSIASSSLMHNMEAGTSLSFSYTVPSGGENTLLVVYWTQNHQTNPSTLSQNGVSAASTITRHSESCSPGMANHYFAYLAAPTTGTFSMTWSGTTYANVAVFTVKDAAQASAIDVENMTCATASSKSTSVTTTTGNDLLLSFTTYAAGAALTSFGAGEAQVTNGSSAGFNSEDYVAWKSAASTPGTETMTSNLDQLANIDHTVLAIKRATSSPTVSTSIYHARIDDGRFNTYTFENNGWTMYDKNGTRYLFGATTTTRQAATSSPSDVFKWMLEEVRDTNGNYIKYEYISDENQIYPSKITYTRNGTTDGPFEIDFTYETRPDTVLSYATAFKVQTKKRLTQVQASIDDSWVRKYVLTYANGVNGSRSMLASVTESGRDESGTETSLPGFYFSYSSSTPAYTSNASVPQIYNGARIAADVDGNGLPDWAMFRESAGSYIRTVKTNNYPSFSETNTSTSTEYWAAPTGTSYGDGHVPTERGVRFFDANGDGLADIVKGTKYTTGNYERFYHRNYSDGYTYASTSLASGVIPAFSYEESSSVKYSTGFLGNVNGDGLTDYVLSMPSAMETIAADNGTYLHVASSTGWTLATSTFSPIAVMATSPSDTQQHYLVDINGDGLDDWMNSASGSTDFCLNTGTSWTQPCLTGWTIATTTRGTNGWDKGVRFVDVNGDGLVDYARAYDVPNYSSNTAQKVEVGTFNYVYLNTGSGWATSTLTIPHAFFQGNMSGSIWTGWAEYDEPVDWNGDGTMDQAGQASTNSRPDLLIQITHPAGGSTNVTYQYTSQDAGDNADLAFPLLVVTQITDKDNKGHEETATYAYEGGKTYNGGHIKDRRFAGFATITKTDPFGITKTYSNQGNSVDTSTGEQADAFALIGRPYREDVQTLTSSTLRKTFKKWNAESSLGSYLVGLISEMIQEFAGDGSHRDKATDYLYASTTNDLVQATEWGEVSGNTDGTFSDTGTDKRKTTISYAASSSVNMRLPSQKTLFDYNNATTSDEKITYDSLTFGSVNVGNPTKQEQWVSGTTYASTTKTYTSFGLVATSTDPRSNATGFRYDARNLYVGTSTNPLSQQTQYLYDYASGKTKLTIDPNSRRIQNTYNGVGRVAEIKQSDLTTPTTLLTATTFTYTDSTSTPSSIQRNDYLGSTTTVDTISYLDGLRRLIQERKTTESSNVYAVTDIRYKAGNTMGSTSVPYFSSGSAFSEATTTTALYTSYTYDALKRVATTSNIVGTTTNAYAKWTVTFTDALGNIKDYWRDAFGNLVNVVEHGSSIATTTYAYDSRNNLATTTDGLSNVRAFAYDGLGRRTSAQDLHVSGDTTFGSWSYSYDLAGNLTSQTDPKSQTVDRTYDALNRMLTEDYTGGSGTEVVNTYDSCTNGVGYLCMASSTSALVSSTYDILGRLSTTTATILGTTSTTTYAYNRKSDITEVVYPDFSRISYTYNLAGLPDRVEHKPAGGSFSDIASFTYAAHGLPSFTLFGNNASTTRTYDERALYRLSRLLTGTSTPLQDASYTYDANGNILNISHATGTSFGAVRYTYDALNRLIAASAAIASTTPQQGFTYDVLGGMLTLSNETITGTSTAAGAPSILDSMPVTMRKAINTTSHSFSYTVPSGGANKLLILLLSKNDCPTAPTGATQNGQSLTLTLVSGTSNRACYYVGYLANPSTGTFQVNFSGLTYADYAVFTLQDAAQSSPIDVTNVTNEGNQNSNSTSVTTTVGNDLLLSLPKWETATWSSYGTGETEDMAPTSSDMGWTAGSYKNAASTAGTETMTINISSSRDVDETVVAVKSAGSSASSVTVTDTYTYAGTNYANPHAVTQIANGVSTTTFAYDNNGNLIQKIVSSGGFSTTTLHVWDYNNRLIQTAIGNTSTTTTTYGYDAFGMRVFMGVNGATTTYPSKFFSRIFSMTGATTTATTTAYIYAGDTLLATFDGASTGTTTSYIHGDHLGSTALVTSSSGSTTLQTLDYMPYGSIRTNSNTGADTGRKYIGLFEDATTDLIYANARYLEPSRGQFISQDPTFQALGDPTRIAQLNNQQQKVLLADPQTLNSYAYARSNPVVNKDPTGLCFEPLSALVCIYGAYTAASLAIDAYDVYQTNFKYGDVFSQEEKNATNFNFGLDVGLAATGYKVARDAGKAAGVGFESLTATLDALDTYFGELVYKKYNENHDPNKKKESAVPGASQSSGDRGGSYREQTNSAFVGIPRQNNRSQYSTPSQMSGGSNYGQLVSSLNRLVGSLKAYVSSLSGSKDKKK